jgi:hypothetical protein
MVDEKDKHTPESVAAKVVKALLKVSPKKKQIRPPRRKKGRQSTRFMAL